MPREYLDEPNANAIQPTNLREEFQQITKTLMETQKILNSIRDNLLGPQASHIGDERIDHIPSPQTSPPSMAVLASMIAKLTEDIRQDLRALQNRL